ncbi:MAG: arginine repressor [Deltaproteobacteria bacterium]|nr:arginine repressor [Deltaproteobacteria bacterium]
MPNKIENWSERHATIRNILATCEIHSQTELVSHLKHDGYYITQSSVSRDLAEIRAFKVDGRYVTAKTLYSADSVSDSLTPKHLSFKDDILNVAPAGPYMLVIKTPVGRAASVGIALDQTHWPEIIGTIAGDDTVFVATSGRRNQSHLQVRLTGIAAEKI